jgi:anti-sigma B factor antagonist
MTFSARTVEGVTILDIRGALIEDAVSDFWETVRPLLLSGGVNVVVNLRDVPYVDSAALGEIIRVYTTATRLGGTLKLLHVHPRVRELLATTRLDTVLASLESEDDAVRSFGAASP